MSDFQTLLARKAELDRQQAELDKQLQAHRQVERQEAIRKIKALMTEHGIVASDLGAVAKVDKGQSANAGRKVAAKYRNTETGETWTGRGLKPKWIQTAMAAGKSLESFLI